MRLIRLLRTYLRQYRAWLLGVLVFQLVATIASLSLPRLNADIIDNGIAQGDTAYIARIGVVMLAVALVQIAGTIAAVYFGARTSMGVGRDVRAAVFRRVGSFSSREVARFGAPSLITRNTNDVQQVQMLVLLGCTLMVTAPIMMLGGVVMAISEDAGLSWLLLVAVPVLAVSMTLVIMRMVPGFRAMQKRIDTVNKTLREQLTGIRVVRAFVREPFEVDRFATANSELTAVALSVGRWMADALSAGDRDSQRIECCRDLVRRPSGRRGADAGRFDDRVPGLPDPDPDRDDDGDLHGRHGSPRRGRRRSHRRGARYRVVRRAAIVAGHRIRRAGHTALLRCRVPLSWRS